MKKLLAEGLPTKDGKIPTKEASAWLKANLDPARRDHWNGNGVDTSLNELRRQREALKIEVGRLELEKAKGDIVDRATVREFIAGRAQMERDAWTAWVSADRPASPLRSASTQARSSHYWKPKCATTCADFPASPLPR
jgi:hypothetical protein